MPIQMFGIVAKRSEFSGKAVTFRADLNKYDVIILVIIGKNAQNRRIWLAKHQGLIKNAHSQRQRIAHRPALVLKRSLTQAAQTKDTQQIMPRVTGLLFEYSRNYDAV